MHEFFKQYLDSLHPLFEEPLQMGSQRLSVKHQCMRQAIFLTMEISA